MPTLRPEHYHRRQMELDGWQIGITSYKLGDRFICEVDNVEPGARIARGEGATREAAEESALVTAQRRLGRTRVHTIA